MENNLEFSKQLLLFKDVAEELSFSAASVRSGVSKGYLSKQVRALEKSLGVQLLYRSTRSVKLTAEGKIALQRALDIQRQLDTSKAAILEQQQALKGTITITAPVAFAEKRLIKVCHAFTRQYPDIEFVFDVGNELRDIETSQVDVAIRITNNPPPNMIARHLTQVMYWCVGAPAYFDSHPEPLTPTDLEKHNCISLSFWRKWTFFHQTDTRVVEAKGSLSYPQNNLLREAALLGAGIINVPSYVVEEDVASGRLVKVLGDYMAEPRLVYVIYPQRTAQTLKLRTFIDFLMSHPEFQQN